MIVLLFLVATLLSCQTAAKSYGESSKLFDCSHSYRFEKSMTMGNRAWIVSNHLETGQDIICSHMTTSDGLRMCACACQTNVKGISNDNDITWTVPKYKKCSHPEDAKDTRLYCYDLATTDQKRKCSCTCSTVKDELPSLITTSQIDEGLLELKVKKSDTKSEYRADSMKSENLAKQIVENSPIDDELLPNIIDETNGKKLIIQERVGNDKGHSSNAQNVYMHITNSLRNSMANIQEKTMDNTATIDLLEILPSESATEFNAESLPTTTGTTRNLDLMIIEVDNENGQTSSSKTNTTSRSSLNDSLNVNDGDPYVVYVTTEKQSAENHLFSSSGKSESPDDLIVKIEMKYPESNSKKLVEKPISEEGSPILGPLTADATTEKNIVQESGPQTKQPRLMYYLDAIKSRQNVLNLDLTATESLNQPSSENSKPEDNIVVVYPKTSFVHSKPNQELIERMHSNPRVVARDTKTDEKVFYVYSQPAIQSPSSLEASFITPENMKVQNMSDQYQRHTVSKQSSVRSSTGTRLNSVEPSPDTLLSIEKTIGSPILISLYPVVKNASAQMIENEEKSIESNEPTNEISSPDDSATEKLKETDDVEDYLDDESVTIAYSAKVFQSIPADTIADVSPEGEKVASITMDHANTPPTEKSVPSLTEQKTSIEQGKEAPSVQSASTTTEVISSTLTSLPSTSLRTVANGIPSSTPSELLLASPRLTSSAAPSTPKAILSTTHSTQEDMAETMKLSAQEELKLKRQNQFMEFLKRKSHDSSKHRLTATSLKRPSPTHVPLTEIRKMLHDAAQRRNALLKGRDQSKMAANTTESSMDHHEKVEGAPQNDSNMPSTTAEPKTVNSKRGGILHRRQLHARTTKSPVDLVEQ